MGVGYEVDSLFFRSQQPSLSENRMHMQLLEAWPRRCCHLLELCLHLEENNMKLKGEQQALCSYAVSMCVCVYVYVCRYNAQLDLAKKEGYKKGLFSSIFIAALQFVIFGTFALGYW